MKIFSMKHERILIVLVLIDFVCTTYLPTSDYSEDETNQELHLDSWKPNFNSKQKRDAKKSLTFFVETKLCKSNISFLRPQKLENSLGKVRTIINNPNYEQIIRFETCSSENFPCTFDVFPDKTKSSFCHQNYLLSTLLALDEERNCTVSDQFLIPTSCDCRIEM